MHCLALSYIRSICFLVTMLLMLPCHDAPNPVKHVQFAACVLPRAEALLAAQGVRTPRTQKKFSLHSTHALSYRKYPSRQMHSMLALAPASDVLRSWHAAFASWPAQKEFAAHSTHACAEEGDCSGSSALS